MADEQINNYVRQNLRMGYSRESIKQALASKGYNTSIVDQVASEMTNSTAHLQPLPANNGTIIDRIKDNKLIVEIILLVIVLVIAGYVFLIGV